MNLEKLREEAGYLNPILILKEEIYGNCPVCKTLLCWPGSWKVDPAHWAAKPEIVYCPICLKNVDLKEG